MKSSSQASACQVRKDYPSIDLLKFLCAMLVVAIHVPPLGEYAFSSAWLLNYGIQQYVARLAVPFFFMCTGFLIFRTSDSDRFSFASGWKQACKLYRLYLLWTVLYLPLSIRNILQDNGSLLNAATVFIRDFLFVGSYFHLWYLNAAAFAVLLVSLLLSKKANLVLIIISAFALYLMGLLSQSWFGLVRHYRSWPLIPEAVDFLSKTMVTARNGLFEAFLFVALGVLAAHKHVRISAAKAAVGFVCSMALLLAEVAVLTRLEWIREHDMYLFLVPAAFFLFLFIVRIDLKTHRLYKILRETSSLIFFLHAGIDYLVCSAYEAVGANIHASYFRHIIVLGASIVLSLGLVLSTRHSRLKWLKKLYS